MNLAIRLFLLSAMLLGGAYVAGASRPEPLQPREKLGTFPIRVRDWTGYDAPRLESNAVALLGVDDYLNRVYEKGPAYLGLYIGYHDSQRQGDTLHSPLNCLPGSGWQPLSRDYLDIPLASGRTITVNQYVIQKGLERQVVLYWYQSHGRVVPNEYVGKFYAVYDAVRLNRTDGAMVRVVSPIGSAGADTAEAATAQAVDFVVAMFPMLPKYLPS